MSLRWGIVTAGNISHDFVNALNSYPDKGDQVIVAVAARDKGRAEAFAKLHNIEKAYGSYQELAANKDINVVYIGAINPDHYPITKFFLEHGKHILCEKPFALNLRQSESLIKLAKQKNLFLMEAIWSRFSPAYIDLEKDIAAGKLGDVKFVEGNFGLDYGDSERMKHRELGGSAILDIGIYLLHLAQFVFKDEPSKVTVSGSLYSSGVDESETVILDYPGGRRAVLNSHTRLTLHNKATIYGTKGRVTLEDPFHFPEKVTTVDGNTKEYVQHTTTLPTNYGNDAGLAYQTLEVARCIKQGLIESPRMPHKDTLLLAKLMTDIRHQVGARFDADDEQYP
ncbi:trans-1,2-dihydrobenzene-1,2-diol dehydrogenase-like [Anticarsia gemmatalis]|uniref:trans-1,2-dihydrobenzene-1,2-diol dehydrogenase-like n=1 Tax=Anticarsia gemmatalis TaxID=129554 RepID=UPI003F761900